jgi:predicted aspartyl protease
MGIFHTSCTISHIVERDRSSVVPSLLVDTGSEYTWVPGSLLESLGVVREKKDQAFVMANGQQITRSLGFAIISVGSYFTIDEVVFAEPGDLELLGARTLEGLNLMVDPQRKTLVAAGPVPAAGTEAAPR